MKTYNITITNIKKSMIIILGLILLWIILVFGLLDLFYDRLDELSLVAVSGIGAAVPVYPIWLLLKSLPVEIGEIAVDDKKMTLAFPSIKREILFEEILSYHIENRNGIGLTLKLKNGGKQLISCGDTFSDPIDLNNFCEDFEDIISGRNTRNRNSIERKKPWHEKKWAFPLLVTVTVGCLGMIGIAAYDGREVPAAIISSLGLTLTMWGSYWSAKRKERK